MGHLCFQVRPIHVDHHGISSRGMTRESSCLPYLRLIQNIQVVIFTTQFTSLYRTDTFKSSCQSQNFIQKQYWHQAEMQLNTNLTIESIPFRQHALRNWIQRRNSRFLPSRNLHMKLKCREHFNFLEQNKNKTVIRTFFR